jgi:hypothetical protein
MHCSSMGSGCWTIKTRSALICLVDTFASSISREHAKAVWLVLGTDNNRGCCCQTCNNFLAWCLQALRLRWPDGAASGLLKLDVGAARIQLVIPQPAQEPRYNIICADSFTFPKQRNAHAFFLQETCQCIHDRENNIIGVPTFIACAADLATGVRQ